MTKMADEVVEGPEVGVDGVVEERDSSMVVEEEENRPSTYTIRPKFEKK